MSTSAPNPQHKSLQCQPRQRCPQNCLQVKPTTWLSQCPKHPKKPLHRLPLSLHRWPLCRSLSTTGAAEEVVGAGVDVVAEEGVVTNPHPSILRTTPDTPHQDMLTNRRLECANVTGNLENQVSHALSPTPVSGRTSSSRDLKIEGLTSSTRKLTRT